ncbi:Hydrolase domain-containing protein [Forsythia ovata]|uniref:Hydrolase domain-containing protein n=1 Tax=Forsythia ovata TaxID=205694 RepID=A0ABD1UZG8_9LAMI
MVLKRQFWFDFTVWRFRCSVLVSSGSRANANEAAIILFPSTVTVFTLDFSVSGLPGGEHVTLGWNEKEDLRAVVDFLRADGNISLIGLWGRSVGAVSWLVGFFNLLDIRNNTFLSHLVEQDTGFI